MRHLRLCLNQRRSCLHFQVGYIQSYWVCLCLDCGISSFTRCLRMLIIISTKLKHKLILKLLELKRLIKWARYHIWKWYIKAKISQEMEHKLDSAKKQKVIVLSLFRNIWMYHLMGIMWRTTRTMRLLVLRAIHVLLMKLLRNIMIQVCFTCVLLPIWRSWIISIAIRILIWIFWLNQNIIMILQTKMI